MADVKITVTAENQTAGGFKAVESGAKSTFNKVESSASGMTGKIKDAFSSLKTHWLEVTAGITAAWLAVSKAWSLADMAAQFAEQKESLNALAGQYNTTADAIISGVQQASKGMVSMADAASIAGDALLKNLKPDQVIALAGAAETLSNVTGDKVVNSFRSMTEAIVLGRSRGIEAAVGIIDLEAKYGDLTKTMSEAEKAQAMYAMVMERVKGIQETLGESIDSVGDKMERLTVQIEDLKLQAGAFVIKGGLALYGLLQTTAAAALGLSAGIFKVVSGVMALTDAVGITDGAYAEWKINSDAAWEAAKDLGKQGVDNMSALFASAQDVVAANGKVKNATENAADAEKKRQEAIKKTVEELKGFSTAIKEAGKDALKFADEKFTNSLKAQERSVDGMKDAMKEYDRVLEDTYGKQKKAQEAIKAAMEKAGADPKEIKAQSLVILEIDKALAFARIENWKKMHEVWKADHAAAVEAMKKKQDELTQIKQAGKDNESFFRKKYGLDTEQALDPFQKFYKDLETLDAASASAMKLSGDEKIKAVQGVIAKFKELPTEIKEGDDVLISSLDIYDRVTIKVGELQGAIEAEKQAEIDKLGEWKTALGTAMNEAQTKMTDYQNQIIDLSNKMSSLALQVNDSQAVSAISGIKSLLNSIPPVVTTTVQVNYAGGAGQSTTPAPPYQGGVQSGWDGQLSGYHMEDGGLTPDVPGYASGTSYVPRTGKYQLHQGEQVLTRQEVTNNQQSRSVSIQMGDIVIQGSNKSPEQLAREMVKPLERELRNLRALQ